MFKMLKALFDRINAYSFLDFVSKLKNIKYDSLPKYILNTI